MKIETLDNFNAMLFGKQNSHHCYQQEYIRELQDRQALQPEDEMQQVR